MSDVQILHDRLLTRLREAIASVVDIDTGDERAIEIAATAMTDALGTILARLPAAATQNGASYIAIAMGKRLIRRMAAEAVDRGQVIDLAGAAQAITGEGEAADHA